MEEKATGEIGAGAGVGTEGTSFSFFLTENNWLGRGVAVQGSLDISEESLRGGINVVNPNYNYSGNTVSAGFNNSKVDDKYFSIRNFNDIVLGGEKITDLYKSNYIGRSDLDYFIPISKDEIRKKGIEMHYLGYYQKWLPQEIY